MAKKTNREYLRMPKINPSERHFVLVLIASILIPLVRTLFKVVATLLSPAFRNGRFTRCNASGEPN